MAEEQDWVKRRQRIVKCKIHGLSYDPEMTSGCVRCRKEGLGAEPRQKPQLVVLLLALLGMTVIAYRIIEAERATPFLVDEPAVEETLVAPVDPAERLDPEPYREPIKLVERALFETPDTDLRGIATRITDAFRRLMRALNKNTEANARATFKAIDELVATVPETASVGSLEDLRSGWTRLRNRHFNSARWYVNPRHLDARTDRAALATYRATADDLTSLINEGLNHVRTLSRPAAPNLVDPNEEARKQEGWRLFQPQWSQRIESLKRQLPSRPDARAEPEVLVATQRLEQAFSQVTSLSRGNLPSEDRLHDALNAVLKARRSFDTLLLH